jgi:hypothetical protein
VWRARLRDVDSRPCHRRIDRDRVILVARRGTRSSTSDSRGSPSGASNSATATRCSWARRASANRRSQRKPVERSEGWCSTLGSTTSSITPAKRVDPPGHALVVTRSCNAMLLRETASFQLAQLAKMDVEGSRVGLPSGRPPLRPRSRQGLVLGLESLLPRLCAHRAARRHHRNCRDANRQPRSLFVCVR